jgi:lipoprotein-anchoring transpeptidase ErfK/SrfK
VLLAGGTVAYLKLREAGDKPPAKQDAPARQPAAATPAAPVPKASPGATPALQRPSDAAPAPAASTPDETRAREILSEVARANAEGKADRVAALLDTLRQEAWDAPSARDFALRAGWNEYEAAQKAEGAEKVRLLDRARRLLSRGVYAPQAFHADGSPRPERATLIQAIQKANVQVMRHASGVAGVSERFEVPAGWAPVQIVSRQKLPYGHNALLFWNHGGNLDPTRLRAGAVLLLPKEELTVHVHLDRHLLGLFLGDWFVKEFRVGVGKAETPTPVGVFTVEAKHENPDWHSKNGVIPFGDPRNELGVAWIPIVNDENPRSYGIHGTNRPDSVGSHCSEGCVRLSNEDVRELFWWVRSGTAGGPATKVFIH